MEINTSLIIVIGLLAVGILIVSSIDVPAEENPMPKHFESNLAVKQNSLVHGIVSITNSRTVAKVTVN